MLSGQYKEARQNVKMFRRLMEDFNISYFTLTLNSSDRYKRMPYTAQKSEVFH